MKKRQPNFRVSPSENLLPQFLGGLTGTPSLKEPSTKLEILVQIILAS